MSIAEGGRLGRISAGSPWGAFGRSFFQKQMMRKGSCTLGKLYIVALRTRLKPVFYAWKEERGLWEV